jgi:hypothetical protein
VARSEIGAVYVPGVTIMLPSASRTLTVALDVPALPLINCVGLSIMITLAGTPLKVTLTVLVCPATIVCVSVPVEISALLWSYKLTVNVLLPGNTASVA